MPTVFRRLDRHGNPYDRWTFAYTDWRGRRVQLQGTTSKQETRRAAEGLESAHREMRLGLRLPPDAISRHESDALDSTIEDYLHAQNAAGGLMGRAWAASTRANKVRHLADWQLRLGAACIGDLLGIRADVERIIADDLKAGVSGKTVKNRAGDLNAFLNWLVRNRRLRENPLAGLTMPNDEPSITRTRRAPTLAEIERLIEVAPPHRALLYWLAAASGLRAGELRQLRIEDLDAERRGLNLRAEIVKNRRAGFLPLAAALVDALVEGSTSGQVAALYRLYGRTPPTRALLWVPRQTAKSFSFDCKKAGLAKQALGGRLDFHALRLGYDALLFSSGATAVEAQTMMRHRDVRLTLQRYGRADGERLGQLAEAVGAPLAEAFNKHGADARTDAVEMRLAVGAETLTPSTENSRVEAGAGDGIRTHDNQLGKLKLYH